MKIHLLLPFLLFSFFLQAQSTKDATPRWLIGSEALLYFENLDYSGSTFGNSAYGLSLEKPIGQFSVGTGIMQEQFGRHRVMEFTGDVAPAENSDQLLYSYQVQYRKMRFWSVPVQAQYRLPCNCVYLQAAVVSNFLRDDPTLVENTYLEQRIETPDQPFFSSSSIRKFSLGYRLGIGLNFHLSRTWKLYTRLIYSQYSFSNDSHQRYKSLGNSYLGLNVGVQHAIY